ncbi:MAG: C4-dicarboxylate ABC transporter [Clostridiaceae bacterium BRH_c20a]|nr:MAG: C4-dicarboxylate ABC transporter [Clostridiaceae bacterium BRH_c20a]
MLVFLGAVIVVASVYFLIKQYESRMVLFAAGVLMALVAGNPMVALQAFATRMTTGGLITAICSVMGFAFVMKYTECDKHLINLLANGLAKVRPVLVPGAVLATFAINIALPSAAGVSAAVGAIFIPLLIGAGIHPAMAATAVLAGTFGSMLNPGLSHNPFIAKLANVDVMEVIAVHTTADLVAVVIGAISLAIVAKVLKEDNGYVDEIAATSLEKQVAFDVKILYAIIPIIPVVLLILGSSILPAIKMGVPEAMLIGAIIGVAVTRKNPGEVTTQFFAGMGEAYAKIMGIIIAAAVFVSGMEATGLVEVFTNMLINSEGIVKLAATFGPFLLAVVSGSGDAAAFAFNEAVTPHAAKFGLDIINMGSIAALGGALGRTMSPICGATIVCASIANVNPMELAKRNAPGMIIAAIAVMFILL